MQKTRAEDRYTGQLLNREAKDTENTSIVITASYSLTHPVVNKQ